MVNQLYEFTMKVARGEGSDMPEGMQGALVPTYVGAPDYQTAVRRGVDAIRGKHYVFEEFQGQVREIPIERWEDYIDKAWPEFANYFPSKEQMSFLVHDGAVFFGPFVVFK